MLSSRPVSANFGDGPMSTKTPGRAFHKNRRENAVGLTMTVGPAHRKKFAMHTPYKAPQTESKSQHLFTLKESPTKTKQPQITLSKPLGDKTPFPNRANLFLPSEGSKLGKLDLSAPPTPGFLPSSTRKSFRPRRSSSLGLDPRLQFQTPRTNGHHWDVSDVDVQVPEVLTEELEDVEEDDYDEIEYMPPKVDEQPYSPPFLMPNYKEVGGMLRTLVTSYKMDDSPLANWKGDMDSDEEHELLSGSGFSPDAQENLTGPGDDRPYFIFDDVVPAASPPAQATPPTVTRPRSATTIQKSSSTSTIHKPSSTTMRPASAAASRPTSRPGSVAVKPRPVSVAATRVPKPSAPKPPTSTSRLPTASSSKAIPAAGSSSRIPAATSGRSIASAASSSRIAAAGTTGRLPSAVTSTVPKTASTVSARKGTSSTTVSAPKIGSKPKLDDDFGLGLGFGADDAVEEFKFNV